MKTVTPADIAAARRIRHYQEAKARKLAPLAEQLCRVANAPAEHLASLPDDAWLQMAQTVDAAGPSGQDVPSAETRGWVIDFVEEALTT